MTEETHEFLIYLMDNEEIYYQIEDAFKNKKRCPEIPNIEYKYLNTVYVNLLNCNLDYSIIEVIANKIEEKYPELYDILDSNVVNKDFISFQTNLRKKLNDTLDFDLDLDLHGKQFNYFTLFLKCPKRSFVLK